MKNLKLNQKKILIILPFYFNYQNQILDCLKSNGAKVYLIDEDVNEFNFWNKVASVYFKSIYNTILKKYYNAQFAKLPDTLDYILVIKGSTLSEERIKYLRQHFGNAKFIMYQWDSVANFPKAKEISKMFDYCYTFDPKDSQKYRWKYRALFFDPRTCKEVCKKKYDLTFICSLHSNRAKVFQETKKIAEKKKFTFFNYIFTNKWSYIRQKYLKKNHSFNIKMNEIKFSPLSINNTTKIYNQSKCLIDYKFPEQEGLTMRTIESLGHKCKLITNNQQIKYEDFYNPKNIWIYDIDNFDIPEEFVRSQYEEISEEIYSKYTIQGWVEDIFQC